MEITSGNLKKPDREVFDTENFLSPLEHDVLGSSVDIPFRGETTKIAGFTSLENKALSIEDLFKEDIHSALTPVGRTNRTRDIEEIREGRVEKNLRLTAFGLYGKDGIVGTNGVKVTLELSDVGEDEEISELRFKFARGENGINPKELGLETWKLEEKYSRMLQTPDITEEGILIFKVKKEKQKEGSEQTIIPESDKINPEAYTPYENIAIGSGYPVKDLNGNVVQMTQEELIKRIKAGTYFINEDFIWPLGDRNGKLTPEQILQQRKAFPKVKGLFALGLFEPEGAGDLIFDEKFEPELHLASYIPEERLTGKELVITFPNLDPQRTLTEADIAKLNLRNGGEMLVALQKPTVDDPKAVLRIKPAAMHGERAEQL